MVYGLYAIEYFAEKNGEKIEPVEPENSDVVPIRGEPVNERKDDDDVIKIL